MARSVDNNGIGALYGTFDIHKTSQTYDLDADDVGKAVALSGNNEVNLGSDGGTLLGRLEQVKDGLATVQVRGVMRLDVNPAENPPAVSQRVIIDGVGRIYEAPALGGYDPVGGNVSRGTTLAVDGTNNTADVLL